jgi:tetratricopeptide (TPR) repeat protein
VRRRLQLDGARAYLGDYEPLAARASRWSRVLAARSRGLLAAAEGDPAAAVETLQRALAEDQQQTYPFERARTLLALGAARRHAGRRKTARDALDQALAIFLRLGARPWAAKTDAELRRISGRKPASDELTETERRVATLATSGASQTTLRRRPATTKQRHLARAARRHARFRSEEQLHLEQCLLHFS